MAYQRNKETKNRQQQQHQIINSNPQTNKQISIQTTNRDLGQRVHNSDQTSFGDVFSCLKLECCLLDVYLILGSERTSRSNSRIEKKNFCMRIITLLWGQQNMF